MPGKCLSQDDSSYLAPTSPCPESFPSSTPPSSIPNPPSPDTPCEGARHEEPSKSLRNKRRSKQRKKTQSKTPSREVNVNSAYNTENHAPEDKQHEKGLTSQTKVQTTKKDDTDPLVMLLIGKNYVVSGSLGLKSSAMIPTNVHIDTCSGVNIVRRSVLPPAWEEFRKPLHKDPGLGTATNTPQLDIEAVNVY